MEPQANSPVAVPVKVAPTVPVVDRQAVAETHEDVPAPQPPPDGITTEVVVAVSRDQQGVIFKLVCPACGRALNVRQPGPVLCGCGTKTIIRTTATT